MPESKELTIHVSYNEETCQMMLVMRKFDCEGIQISEIKNTWLSESPREEDIENRMLIFNSLML